MWVPTSDEQIRVIAPMKEKTMSQLQVFATMSYKEARLEGFERALRRREGSRARVARALRRESAPSGR